MEPVGNNAIGAPVEAGQVDMDMASRDPNQDTRDVTWKP
jgi:hypothetical protein